MGEEFKQVENVNTGSRCEQQLMVYFTIRNYLYIGRRTPMDTVSNKQSCLTMMQTYREDKPTTR
jgi:hypothetical protein